MSTVPGAIGAALVFGVAGIELGTPIYAQQLAFASVTVCVRDETGVPSIIRERAEADAVRIFGDLGVTLLWMCPAPSPPASPEAPVVAVDTTLRLFVKILSVVMVDRYGSAADSMGSAPGTPETRGKVAYVFYSRIQTFAETHHVDVAKLLAYVMAHELGHLLLPYDAHSDIGIMRSDWNPVSLRYAIRSQLGFTAAQGELIHQRIRAARDESPSRER